MVAHRHDRWYRDWDGLQTRPRWRTRRQAAEPVSDAEGYDLKPNPLTANTPGELVAALREYRTWAGTPSLREMAAVAHDKRDRVAHTTMWTALTGCKLPTFRVVMAIVHGCGGSQEDLRAFATAYRRISLGRLE